jgi:triosephosphate isomerase
MKTVYIGTNWKMTKSIEEGLNYCDQLIEISRELNPQVELFVIPSHTSLWSIKNKIQNTRIQLGAQNMHWEERGPFTGEISPFMLAEIGIDIIELGHSERRQYFNENDEDINKKVHSALKFKMKPLICIGESLYQKNRSISFETISSQLKVCLRGLSPEQASKVLIAYEPVWAIGEGGIPAEFTYVEDIHDYIRRILCELFDEKIGRNIPILYGGSVNTSNYLEYLDIKEVNGLFIGRAAWDIGTCRDILNRINSHLQ